MQVRLAFPRDEDAIVEMVRENAHTRPTLTFNEDRCRATFRSYLDRADPTFFVAEKDGEVIGMLMANFYEHRMADGLFVSQEILYVRPDRRGTRAAALLTKQLIEWAETLGANEIVGGNDNEFNSERTAKFLGRFGFKHVGYWMRRDV